MNKLSEQAIVYANSIEVAALAARNLRDLRRKSKPEYRDIVRATRQRMALVLNKKAGEVK